MRRALCVGLLLFPLFLSPPSRAQEDAVLIEATRFPEAVRRLPASVTVITEDDIARSAARTLPELVSGEVGFTVKDFFGNHAAVTSLDLRGFGVTGAQNTLILLDGRRLNDFDLSGVQWSSIPLAAIERIEILRGTGGVLYGDAASAGVVNVITRSPLKQGPSAEVLGRIASYDTVEGQLYGGHAGEPLGISGSVYAYRSDGYRDNNRNEQENLNAQARWALGEGALDLRAGVDRQDLRLPGARFVQPSIGLDELASDRRGAQTPLDYASRDGAHAGMTYLQRFGAVEASVGLHYRDKDQRSYFDQGGFPTFRADDLTLRSLTPRLRVPAQVFGMAHRFTLGADFHEWEYFSRRTDRPENLSQPTNRVQVTRETSGFYVHDTIDVTPVTVATLGYRTERAEYSADDAVDLGAPACFFCAAAPSVQEVQKQRAWEVGLKHWVAPPLAFYGRLNRSFRFVNAEEIYESDAFFAPQFQLLRPQHARTAEIGAEWRRKGNLARAALFRTEITDEIHLDAFTTGVGNTNLPPSRREGLELDARWQAARSLTLFAGYAYTEARFLEGTLPGSPFAIGTNLDIAGNVVPLVPRHKLNLGIAWDIMPGTRASAAFAAVGEQVMDNDEPNTLGARIPAYEVLDVKLAQRFSWGRLSAAIHNVFDEEYFTYAVRSAFTVDRYGAYPLPGRTFSLTAELVLR